MIEVCYNAGSFEAGLQRAGNTMQTLTNQPDREVDMADNTILHGRDKVNPYQTYLSEDYRINADDLIVRNIAPKRPRPGIIRFLEKMQVSEYLFYGDTLCWEWKGTKSPTTGYGQFKPDGRRGAKLSSPHRFAYEYFIGPIPEGYEVDHLCGVRHCCNPLHLEAVTIQENRKRRDAKKTHCKNGHRLDGDNLAPVSELAAKNRRKRICRICANERARQFIKRNPGYYSKYNKTRNDDAP